MNSRAIAILFLLMLIAWRSDESAHAADGPSLEEEISKARKQLEESEGRLLPEARVELEKSDKATRDRLRTEEATRLGREVYYARLMQEAMVWTNVARVKELLEQQTSLAKGRAPAREARAIVPGKPTPPVWWSPDTTWLSAAARIGSAELTELLLSHGAETNPPKRVNYSRDDSPLHYAVRFGQREVTGLLLKAGARVEAEDGNGGDTPLMIAVGRQLWPLSVLGGVAPEHERARMEVAALLLAHGADLLATNVWSNGRSPLDLVEEVGRVDWLDVMLANTRKPSRPLRDGDTLLHVAARHGRVNMFEHLAAIGIDINATNNAGLTPWHVWVAQSRLNPDELKAVVPTEPRGYYTVIALGAKRDIFIHAALGDTSRIADALAAEPALLNQSGPLGRGVLHWVAECGRSPVVDMLVRRGAAVNAADAHGETPLHLAAKNGYAETARLLLIAGARLNARNQLGETPISHAAAGGHVSVLELLLSNKADLGASGEKGTGPLHRAVTAGQLAAVQRLLDAGTTLDARDELSRTALHLAVMARNLPVLDTLLAQKPLLDTRDSKGSTPLDLALLSNQQEIAAKLIASGARIAPATDGVTTPLHLAARNGDVQLIRTLIAAGAGVKATNEAGVTAYFVAATNGHARAADSLLLAGADVNERDINGSTALHLALKFGSWRDALFATNAPAALTDLRKSEANADAEPNKNQPQQNPFGLIPFPVNRADDGWAVWRDHPWQYLLAAGADTSITNRQGQTALHSWALHAPYVSGVSDPFRSLVSQLVRHGAAVNLRDTNGFTALHHAASRGNQQFISSLLAEGADIHATNAVGQTPLHQAVTSYYPMAATNSPAVLVLLEAGARVSAVDKDGDTPLHRAVRDYRFLPVARELIRRGADHHAKNNKGETPFSIAQGSSSGLSLFKPPTASSGLVETIRRGDMKAARLLFEWEPGLANTSPGYGIRPLHWAAQSGDMEMVRLLVAYGADVNGRDPAAAGIGSRNTPLAQAALTGQKAVARFLLGRGADVDAHTAARLGFVDVLDRLHQQGQARITHSDSAPLAIGGSLNQWDYISDRTGWNGQPLMFAVRAGERDAVEWFLQHRAYPNITDQARHSALYYAIKAGRTDIAALLERHGATMDIFTVVSLGDTNRLSALLRDPKTNLDVLNASRMSPLAWAVLEGQRGSVELLLASNAVLRANLSAPLQSFATLRGTPEPDHTLLHLAAVWDRVEIAGVLLDHGAEVGAFNARGHAPLHFAAALGHDRFSELLLSHGANPDTQEKANARSSLRFNSPADGVTPLHLAAYFGRTNTVKFLVVHGANLEATNRAGHTPLKFLETDPLKCELHKLLDVPGPESPSLARGWTGWREEIKKILTDRTVMARPEQSK